MVIMFEQFLLIIPLTTIFFIILLLLLRYIEKPTDQKMTMIKKIVCEVPFVVQWVKNLTAAAQGTAE